MRVSLDSNSASLTRIALTEAATYAGQHCDSIPHSLNRSSWGKVKIRHRVHLDARFEGKSAVEC